MFEKVNPSHPDKLCDRIAGAIVDIAYAQTDDPRIAVEVLLGHGICHIIAETDISLPLYEIEAAVERIAGKVAVDYVEVAQDAHLARNQEQGFRCGDNGIFKGMWHPEKINPLFVVGDIPAGENISQIEMAVFYNKCFGKDHYGIEAFNFETVDGDWFGAMPGVGWDRKFQIFGADSSYTGDMNPVVTERAYRLARQARFEYGEKPRISRS